MRWAKSMALVLFFTWLPFLSACSGNNSGELFKTAQFEELQKNREHAIQLYEEIIRKYPDSEFAEKSKERLSELTTH